MGLMRKMLKGMKEYDLTFPEAVKAMSEGQCVECEDEIGAYRFNHDGQMFHYLYQHGWVNACLNGEQCARKWRVTEWIK